MKIGIIVIVISILSLGLISSCCVNSRAIGVEVSCDQFTEEPNVMLNEFEVEVGDKITVKKKYGDKGSIIIEKKYRLSYGKKGN